MDYTDIPKIDVPGMDEQEPETMKGFYEHSDEGSDDRDFSPPALLNRNLMPEIKGLELLKSAGSTIDIGKTIQEMFSTIRNMESQMEKVISINATLEKDLKASKEVIAELKVKQAKDEEKIKYLEEEIPSKKELLAEIEHLTEERNKVQPLLHDMKIKVKEMETDAKFHKERVGELEEEKSDLLKEITYLEVRMDTAVEKINSYEKEVNTLNGERVVLRRKLDSLNEKYNRRGYENMKLSNDLRESRNSLSDLHSKLAETKISSERSFYGPQDDE